MKKIIFMIGFVFLLTGCGMYIGEEKSDDFKELLNQYETYVDHDISEDEHFFELINRAMIDVIPSIVKVEVSIYSNVNILIEKRISSGVIYEHIDDEYFILIDKNQMDKLSGQKIEVEVIDYMSNRHVATHLFDDLEEPISILKITSRFYHLEKISLASHTPKIGEPVLLLGNHFHIQNATSMGLITNYRADLNRMYTSIPSDDFSQGGAIINSQLELIGLQIEVIDHTSVLLTKDAIIKVITNYQQSKGE